MFAKLCAVRANRGNRNKKGFTLAELLIVVAIIGVLVAIAIPVFKSQLDGANEAVKEANNRSMQSMAAYQCLLDSQDSGTIYFSIDDTSHGLEIVGKSYNGGSAPSSYQYSVQVTDGKSAVPAPKS